MWTIQKNHMLNEFGLYNLNCTYTLVEHLWCKVKHNENLNNIYYLKHNKTT